MLALLKGRILAWKTLVQCSISVEIPKVAFRNVQNLHSRRFHISLDVGCWLLALLPFLHLQRLLGTGMQSICKFSLLCRVCKCSSIWLLSIFPCWLPVTPSPVCHLRVFCVISTLERIERCLLSVRPIVYTLPGGALLSFVLALPGPVGLCK